MKPLFLLLLFPLFVYPQPKNKIGANKRPNPIVPFHDMQYAAGTLYAINKLGKLYRWTPSDTIAKIIDEGVSAIAMNRKGNFVYVKDGLMYANGTTTQLGCVPSGAAPLCFDSEDNPVLFTAHGICYKDSLYLPDYSINIRGMGNARHDLVFPEVAFVDNQDVLWLGYDRGDWGGGVVYFDLKKREFQTKPKPVVYSDSDKPYNFPKKISHRKQRKQQLEHTKQSTGYPILLKDIPDSQSYSLNRGIAQNDNGDYLFSNHNLVSDIAGHIVVYEKYKEGCYMAISLNNLFEYKWKEGRRDILYMPDTPGPVAYNKFDQHFYYNTNRGFYKINRNSSGAYSSVLVVTPEFKWRDGMSFHQGYGLKVDKFFFTDAHSFYFMAEDFIGYYNGSETIYYK